MLDTVRTRISDRATDDDIFDKIVYYFENACKLKISKAWIFNFSKVLKKKDQSI